MGENTHMKCKSILKNSRVRFAAAVDIINVQIHSRRNNNKDELCWYKTDEIKSFRRDANMISRAFLIQKIKRKREGCVTRLNRSKTICILGLENRIHYERRLRKASVIREVLNTQKEFQTKGLSSIEFHLALISTLSTFSAKVQALEDGKNVSHQVSLSDIPY